jgi:ubiquinone/menaquinone biosynthesis C-methylase UbiE
MANTVEAVKAQSANIPQVLMQMATGFWISQTLYTVAKLGVADFLTEGPRKIRDLAEKVGANEDYLYRVMRTMAGMGVFQELAERAFGLAPLSERLVSTHPNSMHPVILMLGEENYQAWAKLYEATKSGGDPFEMLYGMHAYDYFKENPEAGETFNRAMAVLARNDQSLIADVYDFSGIHRIVDVGGGNGMLLATILKRHPHLSGILFDLPQVMAEAEQFLSQQDVKGRYTLASGDFFEAVVAGGDAYILSHIVHGFSDELSGKILKSIYKVLPAKGKVLLVEEVLQPGQDPAAIKTKLMDLNMLVMTPGGRDRTREEFAALLRESGFELTDIFPTASGTCVIEAIKP